ncbi:hypothetical protein BYT27DRAFT_7097950 [Phlegmacium glaucopus]|nr:hypothetical protein BYT27DRAFT_7097950 [Phlegmacium glaucopus]
MSEAQSFFNAYDPYNSNEFTKQHQSLDFFSFHSPLDVIAPHPDLFESDIDSNLAAYPDQLQLLTVDSNDAYNYWKAEQPQQLGPPSTITVSSESFESLSSHSDSFYEQLSYYSPSNISPKHLLDLDMEFSRVRVGSEYSIAQSNISLLDETNDPTCFGTLPPTPPRSPTVPIDSDSSKVFEKPYIPRSSYSDFCPPRRNSTSSSDYYSHLGFTPSLAHSSVSPLHISAQLPTVTSVTPQPVEESKGDPRKKYRCTACPRAFARAYNLKTHMATHDPNRFKPHVCPQRSCGRSFSRKHDLGRHLISIHRDESISAPLIPVASKKSVGVENGSRSWCDSCGKGWVGRNNACDCHDIK